jgi:hypothetical protein
MIITWSRLYSSSYAQLYEIRWKLALGRTHCIHTKSCSFFQGNKLSLLALCFAHKLTLKLKSTSREVRCVAPNDVCEWAYPFFYSGIRTVWLWKIWKSPKPTTPSIVCTARVRWAWAPRVRAHTGWPCTPSPCSGGIWAEPKLPPRWCLSPGSCVGGLLLCFSCAPFLNMLSALALSLLFLCIFSCFQVCVLQNVFLQKQVEQGQSISICVKSLFISPVLDYNWWF